MTKTMRTMTMLMAKMKNDLNIVSSNGDGIKIYSRHKDDSGVNEEDNT